MEQLSNTAITDDKDDPLGILKNNNTGTPVEKDPLGILKKKEESESASPGGSESVEHGKPSEQPTPKKPSLSENQTRLKKLYEFEFKDWQEKRNKAVNDEYSQWVKTRLTEVQKQVNQDPSKMESINAAFKAEQQAKAAEINKAFETEQETKLTELGRDFEKFAKIQRTRDMQRLDGRKSDVLESTVQTIYSGLADQIPKEYYVQRLRMSKGSFGDLFDPRSEMHTFGDKFPEEINRDEFYQWNNALNSEDRSKSYDEKAKMFLIEKLGKPGFERLKEEFTVKNEKDRLGFEEAIQEQNVQAQSHMKGVVQDLRDVNGASDFLSFAGNMVGQALYRAPIAIATGTTGSIIAESAEVYDSQLDKIAEKEGITREEVIKKGLDKPAEGQAIATVLGVMDAASAGTIVGLFKQAAKKELRKAVVKEFAKGFAKGAFTEGVTEAIQTEGEEFAAAKGAGTQYTPDAWRIATAGVGGMIGGGVLSGGTSVQSTAPNAQTLEVQRMKFENVIKDIQQGIDRTNPDSIDQAASAIQESVNKPASNEKVETTAEPTTDENLIIRENPETKATPVQEPVLEEQKEQAITPELTPEQITADQNDQKLRKEKAESQISALVESGDLKRDGNNITVLTEKGADELQRIVEENQIVHKTLLEEQPKQQENAIRQRSPEEMGAHSRGVSGTGGKGQGSGVGSSQQGKETAREEGVENNQQQNQEKINGSGTDNNNLVVGQLQGTDQSRSGNNDIKSELSSETPSSGITTATDEGGGGTASATQTQAEVPGVKQRKFSIQLLNDLDLSPQVRKGLSEDAITYIPKGIRISNAEARAIIEAKGSEQALTDFLDVTNGILPDVRVMLGENLIRKFNEEGNWDGSVKAADNLAMQLTDLGRGVNAAKAFSLLTPEGVIRYVQKEITRARDKHSRDTEPKRKKSKKSVDQENANAIEKILDPKSATGKAITSSVKKGKIKQAIDFLEKLKIDQPKGMATAQIIPLGLPIAAWNTAISVIQGALKAGLTISQAINKALKKLQDQGHKVDEQAFRAHFGEQLKEYRVALDPEQAIKEELKAQGITIDEIIRKHYTDQEQAKTSLVDKLIKDANVPQEEAQAIRDEVVKAMDEMTRQAKEKALNKYLPKANKNHKHERKGLVDQIIEASNLGAMDEEQYRDAISEKLGPKGMTEEQGQEIKKLADRIQKAKSDFDRNKAQEDLIRYIDKNVKGIRWTDVGMALWYANILSGLSTQLQNLYGNLTNTLGEAYTTIVLNPKQAGWILKGLFNGYGRGMLEAMDTVRSGYQPVKGDVKQITMSSPVLESMTFKGGPWNPYNYLKYVTRLMGATDIFFYHGLKEMRSRELAVANAKKVNKVNPDHSIIQTAKDELYGEENSWAEANEQAELEGYTGQEKTRRAYELLEKARPEFIQEDSNDKALRGTYNNQPEGALGMLSGVINMASEKLNIKGVKPIKFIVPFTRIIANVTNTALDYSPWAFGRYLKGSIGYEGFGDNYYHKYTQEEKSKLLVKGITGTLAMAALAALTDEEDGIFQITADGTGDMQKNFELQETGWQPYSIKIGDTWYEYRNTPLAIPFAMVGYWRDGIKYRGQEENETRLSILMYGTLKYIMDLSFLQSLSLFFDAFSKESSGSGKNFFEKSTKGTEKIIKSVIVPNAFTQASRSMQEVMDMPQKKANELGDQIIRDMPVLRDRLDNMYNTLGDPVIPNQVSKFLPFKMKSEPDGKDKELYDLIADNNAWIGKPGRTALKISNGQSMTDDEFEQFCYIAGKKTKAKLLERLPELRTMKNGEEIKDLIRKLKVEARREANIQLFDEKEYF